MQLEHTGVSQPRHFIEEREEDEEDEDGKAEDDIFDSDLPQQLAWRRPRRLMYPHLAVHCACGCVGAARSRSFPFFFMVVRSGSRRCNARMAGVFLSRLVGSLRILLSIIASP